MKASLQLGEFLPYRINRLAERVSRSLADVYARRFQISVAQWRVLATLRERPGLGVKAIAESTNLDKVKVSRAVSDLEGRGLVLRKSSRDDGRALELRLSARGGELFRAIEPLALEWEKRLLGTLGSRQRRRLFELLDILEAAMDGLDTRADPVSGGAQRWN